jgi:hypothetical protein
MLSVANKGAGAYLQVRAHALSSDQLDGAQTTREAPERVGNRASDPGPHFARKRGPESSE